MATIFMEPTEIGDLGPIVAGSNSSAVTEQVAGAWSAYSIKCIGTTGYAQYLWDSAQTTFYGQARVYTGDSWLQAQDLLNFMSPNGTVNCSLGTSATGKLTALRSTGTLLGTCSTTLTTGRWYLIQFKVVISDTVGEFNIKLDGVQETITWVAGTATTQDTRNDAAANGNTCDRIQILSGSTSPVYWDDVIINDGTGTVNNSYPDAQGIEALMPNAAGDNTGLTRGGADSGTNYGQVDERPANDATDYVFDSVLNDYDLYNLPSTRWATVSAVSLALRAQKSDAGVANIAHVVKADTNGDATADTEYTGTDLALSTSWAHYLKIYDRQPDATNWSAAKVNALQVGAKVR